jgi:hypothetical protein
MYERHSACVSAHVDARVTAVRARVIHAEGDAPSARRARPVRRLWIDAACVGGVGGCSIDFARAPASRGCVQPAIAPGEFLRDGEEARARPGTPPMHHPPAGAAGARRAQNSPCNARARAASAWLGARAWVVARRVPNGACIRARSRPRGALQSEPLLAPIGLHERGLRPTEIPTDELRAQAPGWWRSLAGSFSDVGGALQAGPPKPPQAHFSPPPSLAWVPGP